MPYERLTKTPRLRRAMHDLAAELRQRQTRTEALLWAGLRNRQIAQAKFRRQIPIGRFVVDFYCAEHRLAIEIDGGIHTEQVEADAERQSMIEHLDIRVLRFTAAEVETDPEAVFDKIRLALHS